MSWNKRVTRQAFSRTDWLTFFLKIWFQEHTHTHTHTHKTKSLRYFTKWRNNGVVNFDIYTLRLFTISMFFLYIFNNYFNKYFSFHKDTNAVVQMLQAFQVSELQYPSYNSDYKHGYYGSPKRSKRDRSLNRQTFGYTYVRIATLYRKTRITNAFLQSIRFFRLSMLQTPIFARSTRLKYKSLERINMSYKIIDLT